SPAPVPFAVGLAKWIRSRRSLLVGGGSSSCPSSTKERTRLLELKTDSISWLVTVAFRLGLSAVSQRKKASSRVETPIWRALIIIARTLRPAARSSRISRQRKPWPRLNLKGTRRPSLVVVLQFPLAPTAKSQSASSQA